MQNYAFDKFVIARKTRQRKISPKLALFFILLIIGVSAYSKKINFPTKSSGNTKKTDFKTTNSAALLAKIDSLIATSSGSYAVYIFDINKNEGFGIHEEIFLTAASVNKIPILAVLYNLAGKNEIDLEKIIIPQEKDIQDYGTGTIRYDPTGTPYSIRTLARLMMEKSDNTAAYILANHIIGLDKIQQMIEEWGLKQTDIKGNKTSVKDMALLLTKMYKGEVTSEKLTGEMLGFMKKSDFDDRLPAGLPPETTIYHKTGDEINKIHDVGIVELVNRPYYLGVMTTDMTDDEKTKRIIAEISRITYEYMSRL